MINDKDKQPTRLNIQLSVEVINDTDAEKKFEVISRAIKQEIPTANVFGNISRMLQPCCGDKKGHEKNVANNQKT